MRHAARLSSVSSLALMLVACTAALALSLATLVSAVSLARADGTDRLIPQAEVAPRLAVRGYTVNEPVIRRGTAYLTHGTDRFGQRLRLVMDARNGELIGLRVIGDPAPRQASRP